MKKYKINSKDFNLRVNIQNGISIPKDTICVENSFDNAVLKVCFNNEIDNPNKCYMFIWDKKNNRCIGIQEFSECSDNTAYINVTSQFIASLKDVKDFEYGRICLAFQWEDEYSIFYLSGNDNYADEYIGYYEGLGFYYSKGNLLSAKFIDKKNYLEKFVKCSVESIELKESALFLSLIMTGLDSDSIEWRAIPKSSDSQATNIKILTKSERIGLNNQSVKLEVDFSDVSDFDFDAYSFAAVYNQSEIKFTINKEFEDKNNLLSKIYHIKSNIEFDLYLFKSKDNALEFQIAQKIYPYMFSVVMAVYNTEYFLRDALDSLVNQNTSSLQKYLIGNKTKDYKKRVFAEVYQVILVDDGATDSSGMICDEYAEKYENFSVIHKENGGVSSARNRGIKVAEGKYLNFMDSDDKFSDNVFSECFPYFEKHYDQINIITFPIKFFDASSGDHWLNDKFKNGNRIIDLLSEHDKSLLFVNASIFKAECVKNKIEFEESLVTGEDVRFIYTNLFKNGAKFGVIDTCVYWYRRRSIGEASAIQESNKTRNYYYEYLTDCLEWLLSESKEVYTFVPYYVQYLVAQQLQWRFVTDQDAEMARSVLDDTEFSQYKKHITEILQKVDTNIILEQKRLFVEHRKFVLEMKYGCKASKYYDGKDILYYIDGHQLSAGSSFVRLEFLKINGNEIYIEGYNRTFENQSEFYIKVNGERYPVDFTDHDRSSYALGEVIYKGQSFVSRIQLDDTVSEYVIGFYEKIDSHEIHKSRVLYHKRMPLTKKYYKSYYTKDGWGIRLAQGNLKISNLMYSNAPAIYHTYEKEFVEQVMRLTPANEKKRVQSVLDLRKEILEARALIKQYSHKKIWLISDRVNVAGDNGEAFFRYMAEKKDPNIEFYFVINEKSPDYKRLKQIGNVVAQNSRQHKVLHLLAEYIISSQGEEYVFNPFYQDGSDELLKDLISVPKFIFLQHGVIKDDLSGWLTRFEKNIYGFITAAVPEYQSILDYDYCYSENEVWLTGLPRHDLLYHDEKKYITIMPTWRSYLVRDSGQLAEKTVVDNFSETDFFKFYDSLLNDERLLSAAEEYGYTIAFKPHPHFTSGLGYFSKDPRVIFFDRDKPYKELFAESDLMITDYSSSVMDFVYLRKPVVYCHFDSEEFFSGKHTYEKGYFDYERDGFGEVTYDLNSLVDKVIEYMKNNCKLSSFYEKRIDQFFAYNDHNNCERLYNKLIENN